jgi:hypothetical protein
MSDPPRYRRDDLPPGERHGREDDAPSVRSLTFDSEEGAYIAEFDDGEVPPSTTVVSVIAAITGQSVTDLRPLYHVVDPDALDRIVRDRPSRPCRSKPLVEFTYQALTIRLLGSGVLKVYPPSPCETEEKPNT